LKSCGQADTGENGDVMTEEFITIKDAEGLDFQIQLFKDDRSWFFKAFYRTSCAAHMHCSLDGDHVTLCDLNVFDKGFRPRDGYRERVRRFLLSQPKPEHIANFRGRGLGTILLQLLAERGKRAGFLYIQGKMVDRDIARYPHLPDWYKCRGFEVTGLALRRPL
jgi:hypothetical protein